MSNHQLPDDLAFEMLDGVCQRHLGEALKYVSFVTLSSFSADRNAEPIFVEFLPWLKGRGNYRLLLQTTAGPWRLVYKNDRRAPSMSVFQEYCFYGNVQGRLNAPTEFLIYSSGEKALAAYLPKVYVCTEMVPNLHYQYLLEDLHEYRPASRALALEAATMLPALHGAMQKWGTTVESNHLFRIKGLRDAMGKDLENYAHKTCDELVLRISKHWAQFFDNIGEFGEHVGQPIHGDLWPANILINSAEREPIKIIDWESVAWGAPHTDLVTLLWLVEPEIEREALALYSAQAGQLSLNEHTSLYRKCQEEYWLLSAAGCIKELMDFGPSGPLILPDYLQKRQAQFIA